MSFDLLIRGATVVGPGGPERLDVGSADGLIAALGPELAGPATEELDAAGLHLLPGVLDAHVHFNEPGRTDWEGFDTGTRALAAGGATAAIDMPLNAHPPTVTPLPGKGRLEPGADADLALVDLAASHELAAGDLHYRYRHSPFLGRTLSAGVVRTLVRGRTAFAHGRIVGPPTGRLLTPATEMESP